MDATQYDWSRFSIVFYFDQPVDVVFAKWATSEGLASFFVKEAMFASEGGNQRAPTEMAQAGDIYTWRWRHDAGLEGRVLAVEPDRVIEFTFGDMRVGITFTEVDGQTELHLVQTGIADSDHGRVMSHLNCRSCWIYFITNLKSVLDQGFDLRVQDPKRVSSMEVGFVPLSES